VNGTGLLEATVVREGAPALHDVTLMAEQGELLVVLGPSGSGKSTVLRAISGLARLQHGEVYIGGRRVTRLPPQQRGVAMIFETSTLLPFLDVEHNLAWGLRVQHTPTAEVSERVSAQARQLRLSRLLRRKPKQLSTGERGLVGIGRALVRKPEAFLMDEPLAHLDPGQRAEMRRMIVQSVKSLGVTTIYVTHDQAEALAIADRVAVINDGAVVQIGSPLETYERPADLFVAGFVGTPPISVLRARLVVSAGSAGFQIGPRTLPLWAPVPTELAGHVGREVLLGLRAEDVFDAEQRYEPELATLPATVTDVEYTGQRNIVTVEVQPGVQVRSRFPARVRVGRGDRVQIAVDVARAHVFDADSGRALWHPPGREPAVNAQ
jgi:multiple sugar transport system ATP-binding protein